MMPEDDETASLLTSAGLGGVVVCCLGIELLGGAAILGGFAALSGLSTGLTYLVVAGVGGALAALLVIGYRHSHGAPNA